METLIVYGLLMIGAFAFLRALFADRPAPPPVVYVVADTSPGRSGLGCLAFFLLLVLFVSLLWLLIGA